MNTVPIIVITSVLAKGKSISNNKSKHYRKKLHILTGPSMFEHFRSKYFDIYSKRLTDVKIYFSFTELPI